uniref:Uncharacterized protein n=1 Tax=Tetradesmus obliquus TaxID=3088 RepID=A0A383W3U6_TETOB|eukprot:jgi/Sobl393_1/2592/SZX72337.1
MLKAKHHESMLVEASMVQQESGQQQQQQQLHARKRWAQQVQPSWPRLLIPKLVQAGQQHPAAAATQPSGGSSLPWRARLPPAVRRRNRRALQQLGGPLDAMMLGGMGSILGTGGGSALGGLSGISSLASLAGMTGMGDLTGLGGLAGMLGGGGSSNLAGLAGMGSLAGLTGGSNTLAALTGSSNSLAGLAGGANSGAGLAGAAGTSRSSLNSAARYYQQQQQQQRAANARMPGGLEQGYGMYGSSSSSSYGSSNIPSGYGGSSGVTGLNRNFISNTVNGIGDTAWGTATHVSSLQGASLSSAGQMVAAQGGQLQGGMAAAADAALLQRYGQTGERLATNVAPYITNVRSNAESVVTSVGPVAMEATDDVAGLGVQAVHAIPNGLHSLADGAATAIGAATPYVLNNGNSVLDQASNAVQQVAQATKTIMHGTAVPMASAGINTASNMGTYMGNGFAEGFGEGYTAANDRRLPYSQGPSVQQQFESQPALYLPQSFSPLGAMANITYPCPVSRVNNIVAPVGTIIGPGIPCGVNLQLVPRAAVPSNRLAPAVVNVIPVASPVPPPAPAPSSPTPIPVTPLPPGGTPPGGGGTLPPVVPPIVNPSPAPGGTPPVVPPIVNPGSPAPGGTPIPTTPPPATPPTTTPGSSPAPGGLPPGVVPPNINPATPASFNGRATRPNYMSVPAPAGYDLPGSVQVTGPYNSMFEAARTGGYSGGGSRMRGSGSIMAQQQQQQQQQQSAGTAWGSLPSFG